MKNILKGIIFIGLSLVLVFCKPIKSFAAEKEMNIDINKKYSQASFIFNFASEQNYTVNITRPDNTTTTNVLSGTSGIIQLSDITEGKYNIVITADNDINVNASVECSNTYVNDDTSKIGVSSQLSGLNYHFENGVLFVKWNDTNNGRTKVSITNPKTLQKLMEDTVLTTEFSFEPDEDVNIIELTVTPSLYQGVGGSEQRYTIEVIRDVPGEIINPEKTIFNENVCSFPVNIERYGKVVVLENDNSVFEHEYTESGSYTVDIPLNDIENNVMVYLYDEKGNSNSYNFVLKRDIEAPVFVMGKINEITSNDYIRIYGRVTECSMVSINEFNIETDSAGNFSCDYPLEIGDTQIIVSAMDKAGNEGRVEYLITRNKKNNYVLKFIAITSLIGLFVFLFKKKKDININKPKKTKEVKERVKKEKVKAENNSNCKVTNCYSTNTEISLVKQRQNKCARVKIISLIGLLIAITIVCSQMIKITKVMSGSMEPTLKVGSYAIYNQLAYKVHDIERGDIVCFYSDEKNKVMAKRVIGIAGDEISFQDGYIFINGLKVTEEYLNSEIETNSAKAFIVPQNMVFVLGDNRTDSYDSRFWENPYISINKVYGKYIGSF